MNSYPKRTKDMYIVMINVFIRFILCVCRKGTFRKFLSIFQKISEFGTTAAIGMDN